MGSSHPYLRTYEDAQAFLTCEGKRPNKESRVIDARTYVSRHYSGAICLTYHSTVIVAWYPDSEARYVDNGGWSTVTTAKRLREYLPGVNIRHESYKLTVSHASDPLTAPRVAKCRTCKGQGGEVLTRKCHGAGYDWYSRTTRKCEHGHHKSHKIGEPYASECYRCHGEGMADYGSKGIPTVLAGPSLVSPDGVVIGPVDKLHSPGKASKASTAYTVSGYWYKSEPAPKPAHNYGAEIVAPIMAAIPGMAEIVPCPACNGAGIPVTVQKTIVHLNDSHGWARESIADWLDTLSIDLRFPVAS